MIRVFMNCPGFHQKYSWSACLCYSQFRVLSIEKLVVVWCFITVLSCFSIFSILRGCLCFFLENVLSHFITTFPLRSNIVWSTTCKNAKASKSINHFNTAVKSKCMLSRLSYIFLCALKNVFVLFTFKWIGIQFKLLIDYVFVVWCFTFPFFWEIFLRRKGNLIFFISRSSTFRYCCCRFVCFCDTREFL